MTVSQIQANTDLDATYGSGTPATLYLAIATALPNFTGNGTVVEPTVGQWDTYVELPVTNNVTNWPASANGTKTNGATFTFATPGGASTNNVPLLYLVVRTALGGGRIVDALPLPNGTVVTIGTALSFPAGSITITET